MQCDRCHGFGWVTIVREDGTRFQSACRGCGGTGYDAQWKLDKQAKREDGDSQNLVSVPADEHEALIAIRQRIIDAYAAHERAREEFREAGGADALNAFDETAQTQLLWSFAQTMLDMSRSEILAEIEEGDSCDAEDLAELREALENVQAERRDFARVVVEVANHSRRPCPDCEGAGYTVEMEAVEVWVPDIDPRTGDIDESGRGYYEQAPSPTRELCETCHGGGELIVLSSRFIEELVEPLAEDAQAALAATEPGKDDGE